MSATADRVGALVAPLLAPEVSLYDVEYEGATLRIVVDRPGGVDVATLAGVTRSISTALDEADPIDGRYTLEVSSPGLERRLRTREHFLGAVGEQIEIKTRQGTPGDRRSRGVLSVVGDGDLTLTLESGTTQVVDLGDITRAQVHIDWSPPPKPGAAKQGAAKQGAAKQGAAKQGAAKQGAAKQRGSTPRDGGPAAGRPAATSTEPEPTDGEHR